VYLSAGKKHKVFEGSGKLFTRSFSGNKHSMENKNMSIEKLIKTASGEIPADILLKNCRIINTYTGEIIPGNIAIYNNMIAGIGDYQASETHDMKGMYASPGFIDAHVHIESSMSSPPGFAKAVLPHGTTSVIADPHEIANVLGTAGIKYMLDSSENLPVNFFFALPSCVPATAMETSGACLEADDLRQFYSHPRVVALAEVMNYPGVISCSRGILDKINDARSFGRKIDGHAPLLSGKSLSAYVSAGIESDHECSVASEAIEKLRLGMKIMIREGTCAKNLSELVRIVNPVTSGHMMWCTDDRHPHDLLNIGHIDSIIVKAIREGLDPVTAIRMGTINPAVHFGLRDAGAIAPGKKADIVFFSDLENPVPEIVYAGGRKAAENGKIVSGMVFPDIKRPGNAMNVNPDALDFSVKAESGKIRVVTASGDQLVTGHEIHEPYIKNGLAVADTSRDILKIAVVERYTGRNGTGLGFIKGFGLKKGAIASSVCHDSHNLITVGTNDDDMLAAVRHLVKTGGGLAVACEGKITASLPLETAGLMSEADVEETAGRLDIIADAVSAIGSAFTDPFMTLAFMALPVIPDLKMTDKGLFDVRSFSHTELFRKD
jgi:adenine deaminase